MTGPIPPDDAYHVLHAILDELPPGTAKLERDDQWGRSVLTPTAGRGATIYAVGSIGDCEIGIVELTHSHFESREEALAYCRDVVRGQMEFTVWREGRLVVRAQRHHKPSSDGGTVIDVMEGLGRARLADLHQEHIKLEPWFI